jgi:hypothetical protein
MNMKTNFRKLICDHMYLNMMLLWGWNGKNIQTAMFLVNLVQIGVDSCILLLIGYPPGVFRVYNIHHVRDLSIFHGIKSKWLRIGQW